MNANDLKAQYKDIYSVERGNNLKRLRETITRLSHTEFSKEMGFTKSDLSNLEKGDKNLSLFHILAYKEYFHINYGVDISVDYLMGYTSIITNDNMKTEKQIGLSDKAVVKLKGLDTYSKKILNDFIVNKNFEFLLLAMREYISLQNCKVSITDIMTGENQIVSNPKWMLKYPATEIFSRILDDIYNGYDKK